MGSDPRNRREISAGNWSFSPSISLGPYWVSRFFASASVRPSGDELSLFSTSAMGSVFRSSLASGFDGAALELFAMEVMEVFFHV